MKKKETEHTYDCATNAAEVADEFAALGCTCGAVLREHPVKNKVKVHGRHHPARKGGK